MQLPTRVLINDWLGLLFNKLIIWCQYNDDTSNILAKYYENYYIPKYAGQISF